MCAVLTVIVITADLFCLRGFIWNNNMWSVLELFPQNEFMSRPCHILMGYLETQRCAQHGFFSGNSHLISEVLLLSIPKELALSSSWSCLYRYHLCAMTQKLINVLDLFGELLFLCSFLEFFLCVYAYVYAYVSMYVYALHVCDLLFSAHTFMNVTMHH